MFPSGHAVHEAKPFLFGPVSVRLQAFLFLVWVVSLNRLPTEQFLDLHAPPERSALRSESMLAQFAAVRSGVGIGWLPFFLLDGQDDLCRIPIATPDVNTGLWMVIHSDVRRTTRVRAFADFAWRHLTAMRSRFETSPA